MFVKNIETQKNMASETAQPVSLGTFLKQRDTNMLLNWLVNEKLCVLGDDVVLKHSNRKLRNRLSTSTLGFVWFGTHQYPYQIVKE